MDHLKENPDCVDDNKDDTNIVLMMIDKSRPNWL